MKICSKCHQDKPLEDFSKDVSEKSGVKSYCKGCSKIYWGTWRAANREKVNATARAYRAGDPEKARARVRRSDLKSRFGLTPEDKDRMFLEQEGKCASCLDVFPTTSHACIDHCHATGKIRGLLCSNCNNGLGRFKDSPARLQGALAYLLRFS